MRELEITEIESVSGAEPQPLTDVSQPDYYAPGSPEFIALDCYNYFNGHGSTGACFNQIYNGIQAEDERTADAENQTENTDLSGNLDCALATASHHAAVYYTNMVAQAHNGFAPIGVVQQERAADIAREAACRP
ncbi:MAG: hypothetical protein AAF066_17150 [Pseudomonadota bacterium]